MFEEYLLGGTCMKIFRQTALVLVLVLGAGQSFAVDYCGCKVVTRQDAQRYDQLLLLTPVQRAPFLAYHNPWGVPENPSNATKERVLVQEHYILNHDGDLRVPVWASYKLTHDDLDHTLPRRGCFRQDIRLSDSEGAQCGDYAEPRGIQPRYDRGHIVPSADMVRSEAAMVNTYMFSNMAPQHDQFNMFRGGIWEHLEGRARGWAKARGEVYIIAGSIFDRNGDGRRDADSSAKRVPTDGDDRVAIPSHFYKIFLHERPNGYIETMTILLEHVDTKYQSKAQADRWLRNSLRSIDEIESLTGINFLPDLEVNDPSKARAIEAYKATYIW